ncbi:MAG: mandelate racemase/muconate lactonizing enzyme family protein [Bryobacteraceae bacterium]
MTPASEAFAGALRQTGSLPRLRVAEVRLHKLAAPLKDRFGWSLYWTSQRTATLVEVITEEGLTGWGDGGLYDELRRRPEAVIGRSPFEVEAIFDELRVPAFQQRRPGPQWAGGLDVALWDLIGQALGAPVSQLLGHRYRARVEAYCTALYRKDWPDLAAGLAEEARTWKAQGFRSVKMKTGYGPDLDASIVAAVRDAIGDTALAIDSNCAYDAGTAIALGRRLESYNLLWWEEPLPADDLAGLARLKTQIAIPISGGETLSTDQLVHDYIQPRLLDIVQPEIEFVGFTGGRRLSYLCWLNHLRLVPHNWGTAIRTAAILHWMSAVPPLTQAIAPPPAVFELDCTENPLRDAVVRSPFRIDPADGCIAVPAGPGLGIEVVGEAVNEYRVEMITIR